MLVAIIDRWALQSQPQKGLGQLQAKVILLCMRQQLNIATGRNELCCAVDRRVEKLIRTRWQIVQRYRGRR